MRVVIGMALAGLAATPVAAQDRPWQERVFVDISLGVQAGTNSSEQTLRFELYDAEATLGSVAGVDTGSVVDVTVGSPARGAFGVAFGMLYRASVATAAVAASIPDPARFEHRSVSFEQGGLEHKALWLTPMLVWHRPLGDNLDVRLMAGPAIVRVTHPQVTGASVTESAQGPNLTLTTSPIRKTAAGASIGADVRYFFTPNAGVGGFLRYARASADDLDVGGAQAGIGVRIRY